MTAHRDFAEDSRLEAGQMLNLLLADTTLLYLTTRDYHWNVTGPDFPALHAQFATQAAQLATEIDAIAERARAIGTGARGGWSDLLRTTRGAASSGAGLRADAMLSALLSLHENLIGASARQCRRLRKPPAGCGHG